MGKRLSILPIIEKSLCREHKNVNTRTVENRKSVDERFEIWPGNLGRGRAPRRQTRRTTLPSSLRTSNT